MARQHITRRSSVYNTSFFVNGVKVASFDCPCETEQVTDKELYERSKLTLTLGDYNTPQVRANLNSPSICRKGDDRQYSSNGVKLCHVNGVLYVSYYDFSGKKITVPYTEGMSVPYLKYDPIKRSNKPHALRSPYDYI